MKNSRGVVEKYVILYGISPRKRGFLEGRIKMISERGSSGKIKRLFGEVVYNNDRNQELKCEIGGMSSMQTPYSIAYNNLKKGVLVSDKKETDAALDRMEDLMIEWCKSMDLTPAIRYRIGNP